MHLRLIPGLNPSLLSVTKNRYISIISPRSGSKVSSNVSKEGDVKRTSEDAVGKVAKTKPFKNEPFLKSIFIGKYVYDYMKYPEYADTKEVDELNRVRIDPIREYLETTNRGKIQSGTNFTPDALKAFQQLGLFAQSLPKSHSGLELDSTSVARVLEECSLNGHSSLAMHLIYSNEVAAKSIKLYGNQKQQEKYLMRLASGEIRAGFGFSEIHSGIDASRFKLTATKSSNENYTLNGEKCWVSLLTSTASQSNNSDFVLVIVAKTIEPDQSTSLNAFLLDANTPGVSLKKHPIDGVSLYEVELRNVQLNAAENMLGQIGEGFEITKVVTDGARFLVGSICLGLLKRVFKQVVEYCIRTRRFGKSLGDHIAIKKRLSHIETLIYTMESMVYFTAGVIDSYQVPDVGVESALTKVFCTEALRRGLNECADVMGMGAYEEAGDELIHQCSQTANLLLNMLTSNEVLRLQVATSGVLQAGIEFGDWVVKNRNPLMFPSFMFKQFISNLRLVKSVKKKMPEYFYLWEHVHPSLNEQASELEQSAVRLMMATKGALVNHGREIAENEITLRNLAEIAMHVYAIHTTITRASRSYSIGLENSNHELSLANFQANESSVLVKSIYEGMVRAASGWNYENLRINVADKCLQKKGHATAHALMRNY